MGSFNRKMHQNPFSAGTPPMNPLEAFDALRYLCLLERDTCISPPQSHSLPTGKGIPSLAVRSRTRTSLVQGQGLVHWSSRTRSRTFLEDNNTAYTVTHL